MEEGHAIYEFPSTSGVLVYRVRSQDDIYVCDCPGYDTIQLCRHVRAVLRRLDIHAGLAFEDERRPTVYELQVHNNGTLTCNCREWCFKKAGAERSCKHTREVDPLVEEILHNLLPAQDICRLTGAAAMRWRKQPAPGVIAPRSHDTATPPGATARPRRMVVWEEDA